MEAAATDSTDVAAQAPGVPGTAGTQDPLLANAQTAPDVSTDSGLLESAQKI